MLTNVSIFALFGCRNKFGMTYDLKLRRDLAKTKLVFKRNIFKLVAV